MTESPLMLSVSGLRGIVGASLTPPVAARYAAAVGRWMIEQTGRPDPKIVVGRDSRPSGQMFEHAAIAGLISVGCRVASLGIASTPGVAVMIRQLDCDGAMVITASHNPIIWNGIKTLAPPGVAPSADQAARIIELFHEGDVPGADVSRLQPVTHADNVEAVHSQLILEHINVKAIQQAKLKVVLDSVHGAGGPEAMVMLDALGVEVLQLYGEPTGQFPRPPEPVKDQLGELCQVVTEHHAAAGFAQDPDADRLAVVDETGRYIGEEYTLVLAAMHLLDRAKTGAGVGMAAQPENAVVAANLSTSRMIDDVAAAAGAEVVRTKVGEANVAQAMQNRHAVCGGEGNGGIIWPRISLVRDSLVGIALTLEMLALRDVKLSTIVDQTPAYAMIKDKVALADAGIVMSDIGPCLRDYFTRPDFDEQDGVRLDWPDRWVHVRASNTEPILRVIAEAPTEPDARALVNDVRAALGL